jgi:hypothetical protein
VRAIFLIFCFCSSAYAVETKLTPFLLTSENPLKYNELVLAQRNLIRGRRLADQKRKIKGKFKSWFTQRPHAYYQRVLIEDAPVVVTALELPTELVFYDLFPDLRKLARVDYEKRRLNDRMRFIDYDRHQTILGETVYEQTTGRYLDSK